MIGFEKKTKSNTGYLLRLMKDLEGIDADFKKCLKYPDPKKMDKMTITITPDEGIWKNAPHVFSVEIPTDYPIKPPKCVCVTKIWHPNIDDMGGVCLNILRKDWLPTLTLNAVFLGLRFLFLEPNPNDWLNEKAADHYAKNLDDFKAKAKRYIKGDYH